MIVGYTSGVFDLFHVGHVNILRNARALCDRLIVGVTSDELVAYKGKKAVISYEDRVEVVRACRYADLVVPQTNIDKFQAWEKMKFDRLFVGDDWFGHDSWKEFDERLKAVGVQIIYFPYTAGASSTQLRLKSAAGAEG
jgi:glycerol-3-phosphate cytidylyltransferase